MSLHRNPSRSVVNFSAGPSALPYEVLEVAQRELINFGDLGLSVMEISHRSATFSKIINQAENSVRELLQVPENYKILFLQGGGNGQFSAVAMNLINRKPKRSADYLVTGYWSDRAALEAKKYGNVNYVLPKMERYDHIPPVEQWNLDTEASYVFICDNETIHGVEFNQEFYDLFGNVPLVADCSSNLFTRQIDVSKFGLIFAGAQKNFGPAGVTLVIVREDLLGHQLAECPTIFDYKIQAGNNSLFQTPPTFGIYMCGLVFEWLKRHGGMEQITKVNQTKASLVYDTIDNSNGFFFSPVNKSSRSRTTIPFRICDANGKPDEKLEKEFMQEGEKRHLRELKGHRSVGGIRAAIFNALSLEEVQTLVDYMREFQQKHQQ
jgi:phosphoserine aminotransferase